MIHRLATLRQHSTPVRIQTWNASIRAGDDFKLALTVYDDDTGALTHVEGARCLLALYPDDCRRYSHDYGLGWATWDSDPEQKIVGYAPEGMSGRLNFMLPASATTALCGRYRFAIHIDLIDGVYTEVEGVLQVRHGAHRGLGHARSSFFHVDTSVLDGADVLAENVTSSGVPVDADGFSLEDNGEVFTLPSSGLGGIGVIDPGGSGGGTVGSGSSSILEVGVLDQMVLAA